MRGLLSLAVAVALLTASGTALAATPRTTLNAVEAEVMCVTCGVPLAIAESPQADQERRLIRQLVARGLTKDQIKDRLVVEYGDRVLASPRGRGFGLAAYLVPIALVLGALALLAVLVPRWRRSRAATAVVAATSNGAAQPALADGDARRLAEDLARYDV
jgi:cytochrome c-type biogenesis protein CcmH